MSLDGCECNTVDMRATMAGFRIVLLISFPISLLTTGILHRSLLDYVGGHLCCDLSLQLVSKQTSKTSKFR